MRKALVVGLNHYTDVSALHGCVKDAHAVSAVLERHSDGTKNFDVRLVTATGPKDAVTRAGLKEMARALFADKVEIALLYFAGHGYVETTGGYLCASDCKTGDDGLALNELMTFAHKSPATNKVVVLDSCHSGVVGSDPLTPQVSELGHGMTILTASTAEQYATEKADGGLFTGLLVDALNGSAGNLVGDVTPGSVYAHVDQSLGTWETQRPVFKTNVQSFVSLRKVQPPISLADLLRLTEFFPGTALDFPLDPSFEPTAPEARPEHTARFEVLQRYNRVNLVVPVDAPHMYYAAMESKSCKLTALGEHYRRLVAKKRI